VVEYARVCHKAEGNRSERTPRRACRTTWRAAGRTTSGRGRSAARCRRAKPRRSRRRRRPGRRPSGLRRLVRARPGRLSGLSVSNSKSVFCGAFVWARRALNGQKRRFPAWAGAATTANLEADIEAYRRSEALLELGRIVTLYYRSSTSYHIHEHIR
jgi:hypothetical protein